MCYFPVGHSSEIAIIETTKIRSLPSILNLEHHKHLHGQYEGLNQRIAAVNLARTVKFLSLVFNHLEFTYDGKPQLLGA